MAFNFFKWILGKNEEEKPTNVRSTETDFLDDVSEYAGRGLNLYLQRMALWTCIRKIGSAVGAVEWKTIRRDKDVKASEYWIWNRQPNPNQNRQEFFTKLVAQLYLHQEAIIVEHLGYRYVADNYGVEKKLTGNIYTDVISDGQSIPGTFYAKDVVRISMEGDKITAILTAISRAEGELMKASATSFVRNAGKHGRLTIDELAESDSDFEETYNDLINDKFKKYYTAQNAVLPLFRGYEYQEDEKRGTVQETTRDIRAMMDDIIELTAQTIGMPPSIATGKNFTEADFKNFMTFTVQPLVQMIANEINIKVFGRELVYSKTFISPDMSGVKYIDLFDVANPIDKLIGSGAFCINDIRMRLGLDVIDQKWAWQHWMTKNYATVEAVLAGVDEEGSKEKQDGGSQKGESKNNEKQK